MVHALSELRVLCRLQAAAAMEDGEQLCDGSSRRTNACDWGLVADGNSVIEIGCLSWMSHLMTSHPEISVKYLTRYLS